MIFHIVGRGEWDQAGSKGRYEPASLKSEGFIHCSTLAQLIETANRFYRGRTDLLLLCIDEQRIESALRHEASALGAGSGERYPHIYATLDLEAVSRVIDFPSERDGSFAVPAALGEPRSDRQLQPTPGGPASADRRAESAARGRKS